MSSEVVDSSFRRVRCGCAWHRFGRHPQPSSKQHPNDLGDSLESPILLFGSFNLIFISSFIRNTSACSLKTIAPQ